MVCVHDRAAIACYKSLGFEILGAYEEAMAEVA